MVKIADKISYLGRDIEDAISLGIINVSDTIDLIRFSTRSLGLECDEINTTVLIHKFILDLCEYSSPETGLLLSEPAFEFMKAVKAFNYERIYRHDRLQAYKDYADVVIRRLYVVLSEAYKGIGTDSELIRVKEKYPVVFEAFNDWITKYWDLTDRTKFRHYKNKVIYHIAEGEQQYKIAILDYIAGMTDQYALRMFNEMVSFK